MRTKLTYLLNIKIIKKSLIMSLVSIFVTKYRFGHSIFFLSQFDSSILSYLNLFPVLRNSMQ